MSRKVLQKNLSYDSERQLYYVIFHEGSDGHGHRRRHTRTFHTYQEALEARQDWLASSVVTRKNCTLQEWLTYWLEKVIVRDHAVSTVYGYRNIIRIHIIPNLGDCSIQALTPLRIQNYLNSRMDMGLSANTVLKHYVLLHTALSLAEQMELLDHNPMDRVTPPKARPARYTFYTPQQMRTLFQTVEGTWLELAVKLASYLGLRRSEVCGLRWEYVDFERQVIQIREVRTEIGGEEVIKEPKTLSSIRTLSIEGLQDLCAVLQRTYRQQNKPKEGYVLRLLDDVPPTPDQVTWELRKVVQTYQLPKITMHGLRHSFASIANSMGISMFDISKTLGHSNIAVTSAVYTHLFDETQQETLQVVAKAIEKA